MNHSIFDALHIRPSDGYTYVKEYIKPSTLGCMITLECIKLDSILSKHPTEDIYYLGTEKSMMLIYKNTYTYDEVISILDKLYVKLYYNEYITENGCYDDTKEIISDINVNEKLTKLTNSLLDKYQKLPKLSINIILAGKPGVGKSSFVNYIATKFHRNVYVLANKSCSFNNSIIELACYKDIIVLIPEIDKLLDECGNVLPDFTSIYEFLDGSTKPIGTITLMTCNDLEKVKRNKILSRPGRIHITVNFDLITMSDIMYIAKKYYPDFDDFTIFEQYVGKITHAEFDSAVLYNYICDKPLNEMNKITGIDYEKQDSTLYY